MTWHTPATTTHRGQVHGVPRAARQSSVGLLLLTIAVLFWISPISLLVWLLGQLVIVRQTRWQWHRVALVALAAIGLVLLVAGPKAAVVRHFFVPVHFWTYVALMLGLGPAGVHVSPADMAYDLLITQFWLGLPIGLLAAALAVRAAEKAAGGAEWHPLVQRRMAVIERAKVRRAARALADVRTQERLPALPLGVALDGDLPSWVVRTRDRARRDLRFVIPPVELRGKGMAIVGTTGSGKTVTLLRLAYLAGVQGLKVCFVDCKGTDRKLKHALAAAYRLGNPTARVGLWPESPMDMWRGDPAHVHGRLMAVESISDTFWERVASAGLRLALTAPGVPPVASSEELLERLDVDRLAELWDGHPLQMHEIRLIGEHLPGARLRYGDFFATLRGAFDGTWSFEDVDLAVITIPTLMSKTEADAAIRILLEDYGHYATARKPREGEDAVLELDEFSAMGSGVDAAISMLERLRDVGVKVIPSAQSFEGLGNEHQADRLLASCAGGIIVHQCPDPERLLARAGVVRELEQSWNLDPYGPRGLGEIRMGERPRIDADMVRAARQGEAWVIQAGRYVHMQVLPPPRPEAEPVASVTQLPVGPRDTAPLPLSERATTPLGRIAAAVAEPVAGISGQLARALAARWRAARRRLGAVGGPR
jgi:hypothetical protein